MFFICEKVQFVTHLKQRLNSFNNFQCERQYKVWSKTIQQFQGRNMWTDRTLWILCVYFIHVV